MTIDGADSMWNNGANVVVGFNGQGSITVSHGGTLLTGLSADGHGSQISSTQANGATVTVTGAGSTWTNTDELRIGFGGNGLLQVLAGGAV